MNTRLQKFIAAENITQAQFADSINVARASVSHILAGRNKPGFDFISSMARCYPSLNIDWLITGKGKMYKGMERALNEDGDDLLFHDEDIEVASDQKMQEIGPNKEAKVVDENSVALPAFVPNIPQKQRKAVKVVVFYDDNTFQEF